MPAISSFLSAPYRAYEFARDMAKAPFSRQPTATQMRNRLLTDLYVMGARPPLTSNNYYYMDHYMSPYTIHHLTRQAHQQQLRENTLREHLTSWQLYIPVVVSETSRGIGNRLFGRRPNHWAVNVEGGSKHLENFAKKARLTNAKALTQLDASAALKKLKDPMFKISSGDNPKQGILPYRLKSNKSNFMAISEALGGDKEANAFIKDILIKEIVQQIEKGVGTDCWLEHPCSNMERAAKTLIKETLSDLKEEEEWAADTIKKAYREHGRLNPKMPGSWRPTFNELAPTPHKTYNPVFVVHDSALLGSQLARFRANG